MKFDNCQQPASIASRFVGFLFTVILLGCVGGAREFGPSGATSSGQRPKRLNTEVALSTGEILEAERGLSDLGYWAGPVDGVFDGATRQALIAFQKVEARPRTGKLTREELQALRSAKPPRPLERGYAHIEVDLTHQVLFAVDQAGFVTRILPISTGSGKLFTSEGRTRRAVTPRGRFIITHKIAGWRKSPLGLLYYPNYITRGVAIHGNPSVPVYPASHGCIRIPMFAAKQFSEINSIGTVVIVYESDLP